MRYRTTRWTLALLLLALGAAGLMWTQSGRTVLAQSGGGFDLSWHVVSSGGGPQAKSTSFQLNGTVSQPGVGTGLAIGASRQVGPGFWYGIGGDYSVYLPLVLRAP